MIHETNGAFLPVFVVYFPLTLVSTARLSHFSYILLYNCDCILSHLHRIAIHHLSTRPLYQHLAYDTYLLFDPYLGPTANISYALSIGSTRQNIRSEYMLYAADAFDAVSQFCL